jgi:hypothetical protein
MCNCTCRFRSLGDYCENPKRTRRLTAADPLLCAQFQGKHQQCVPVTPPPPPPPPPPPTCNCTCPCRSLADYCENPSWVDEDLPAGKKLTMAGSSWAGCDLKTAMCAALAAALSVSLLAYIKVAGVALPACCKNPQLGGPGLPGRQAADGARQLVEQLPTSRQACASPALAHMLAFLVRMYVSRLRAPNCMMIAGIPAGDPRPARPARLKVVGSWCSV